MDGFVFKGWFLRDLLSDGEIFPDKKHRGYKRSKTTDLSQKSEQLLSVDATFGRSRSQVGRRVSDGWLCQCVN